MPLPVRENGKFPYYAFPGGYTIIYIAGDNEVLCPECANQPEAYSTAEKREAIKKGLDLEDGPPDYTDRAWELVAVETYDEGLPIQCVHCNKDIESSYGPTDADYRDMIRDWHHQITKRDPSAGVLEDILQYVKDEEENEGGPNDMRGNYHSIGVFVREFLDHDTKNTIEVWTYDVWGNEEDGYEVNDRSKISEYETDLIELTDKDIKEIIEENFFHPETISSDGNGDDQHIYLVLNDKEHSDYPLGEIYLDRG